MKRIAEEAMLLHAVIQHAIAEDGYAPSVRQLQEAMGVKSTETIHRRLVWLREQGLLDWQPYKPRTLRIRKGE